MSMIEIIGVDGFHLDEAALLIIRRCAVVIASSRHKPLLKEENVTILPIAPVSKMLGSLETALQSGDVAVLASGDPLFFGVARTLINRFGADRITVHPALSAVQLACARFKLPWDDMTILSLHGREPGDLPARILPHGKVMLFTDHRNSPDRVAQALLTALQLIGDNSRIAGIRIRVAENLAMEGEKITVGGLAEIGATTFGPLNIMLVEQTEMATESPVFGLTEHEFSHSRGLITKDEVRAVTLHCLRLPREGVMWDVGGGSGSISVEASCLQPALTIFCLEKHEEQLANIRANLRAHHCFNVTPWAGTAPETFKELPDPDRVFIGGSGGFLREIITEAAGRLKKNGRMVVNAVLPATAELAPVVMAAAGLRLESRTIRVNRRNGDRAEEKEFNPITIITGIN